MSTVFEGGDMETARDLSHDLVSRDWQEYADACFCHDRAEPAVDHARELAHREELVFAMTASTS